MNLRHRSEASSVSLARIRSVKHGFVAGPGIIGHSSWTVSIRAFLLCAVALAALFGMAGCSTNAARPNSQTPLISVAISQAAPSSLAVGRTMQVSATVSNDLATAGVDWIASCSSAPTCGSFSPLHTPSGGTTVYTAPLAVPAKNTVSVTALSATDRSKASFTNVTIISTITSVTITQPPPASAPSGAIVSFAATVEGDPSNAGVDWKATCTTTDGPVDCTPGGFHSASGAPRSFIVPGPLQIPGIVAGTVTITAFATADHNYSALAIFTVTDPLTIVLTQVPPSTMLVNATATVMATVANDSTNSGIDWLVTCANAPCGSVSPAHTASGVPATFTAPPTVPPPSPSNPNPSPVVTITATAAATGGPSVVTATANVTIVVPISIRIAQGVPNKTIVQNRTAKLVATVSGDVANAGMDWTVTCGTPGNCGIFSPAHTDSGVATTFTGPSAIPTGGTITITVASTTDPTKTATETDTVTLSPPPNSLLLGQFVMSLTIKNSSNGPYVVAGVISGDGASPTGSLAGTFDLADTLGNGARGAHLTSGVYSIGSDGRGQIHLQFDPTVLPGSGGSGVINLSVVFVTPQHALLSEIDSFGIGTGTLDLQNLQGFPGFAGGYSLRLSGFDTARGNASYFLASAVTIPSGSSYSYVTDQSDGGVITSLPLTTVAQGFVNSGPDQNGALTLSSVKLGAPMLTSLDLWIIDATHSVVIDWRDSVVVTGYLTAQPSSPSIFGNYAFTEAGATTAAQPMMAGGIFSCGSTGTLDVVPLTGAGTPLTNQPITATCSAPTNGRGLITISGATTGGISKFAAYPTSDQGLYLIELDGAVGPSGAGVALQQTSAPISAATFSGKYASNFLVSTASGLESFAGQIISDGISVLSGTVDVNSFTATPPVGTPFPGATLAGSFTAGANGRFPLMLTIAPATAPAPSPQVTTINPACYIVDANICLLLGLDATAPGTGILQLQNTGL